MPSTSVVLKALSGINWSETMHVKVLSKSQRGAVVLLTAGKTLFLQAESCLC